jgi:hypothetical protein
VALLMKREKGTRPGIGGRAVSFFEGTASLKAAWGRVAALILALLSPCSHALLGAEPDVSKEYQIKAAFLYNFAKFVEWPASALANGNSPMVICVLGKNPFGDELEKLVKGKSVNGHPLIVKRSPKLEEVQRCHLIFAGAGEEERLPEWFAALRDSSVLTVGESQQFGELGGMINFVLEGDKVRFEIDVETAGRAGLKINAQLQKLARAVRGTREIGRK